MPIRGLLAALRGGFNVGFEQNPIVLELQSLPPDALEDQDPVLGYRWFIIRTRSRQEKLLAEDLQGRRIRCFLPLTNEVRYYGRRKVKVLAPLFPGYIFLKGTREDAFWADRSDRAAQLIEVPDQEQLQRELAAIARVLQSGTSFSPCSPLARGTLVEVASGPFKGIQGRVDASVRDNRLVLNVDMIGKAAVLEIDRDLLRPV